MELDPNMVTFLLDHPRARTEVYVMMRNAATTKDDPKMVEWFTPVAEAKDRKGRRAAWERLTGT
jgi:hypothetical protein